MPYIAVGEFYLIACGISVLIVERFFTKKLDQYFMGIVLKYNMSMC